MTGLKGCRFVSYRDPEIVGPFNIFLLSLSLSLSSLGIAYLSYALHEELTGLPKHSTYIASIFTVFCVPVIRLLDCPHHFPSFSHRYDLDI